MYLTHSSEYSVNILLNFYKIQDSTSSKHVKIEILDFCPKPPTSLNRPIFPSIYKRGFGLTVQVFSGRVFGGWVFSGWTFSRKSHMLCQNLKRVF